MTNFKKLLSELIRNSERVALYCYGIQASYLTCYLKKFYNVLPTVIIDNDVRKSGVAEYNVPVIPFCEAIKEYADLKFFICSDDYKYSIIGDMLEKGIKPDDIINYVPVVKKGACLYFYNRLLLCQGTNDDHQLISHCNADSFSHKGLTTVIPCVNNSYSEIEKQLNSRFNDFKNNKIKVCSTCDMNKEQYIVNEGYTKHYKALALYQETCSDCLSHCVYCCVGGNTKQESNPMSSLSNFEMFLKSVLELNRLDDDFSCSIDMSERDLDNKIRIIVDAMEEYEFSPMIYKVNSCLLTYSSSLAYLLKQGSAYVVWSLDAGTAETYKRIKRINAFDRSIETVKRYILEDAFGGYFIVPKYLIAKGINDNDHEFNEFLKLVSDLNLKYVSLSYDFYAEATESDNEFIRRCYKKITDKGLKLTYINNSAQITNALKMRNLSTQ